MSGRRISDSPAVPIIATRLTAMKSTALSAHTSTVRVQTKEVEVWHVVTIQTQGVYNPCAYGSCPYLGTHRLPTFLLSLVLNMATTATNVPSHMPKGTAFYPSLGAYNSALYEYTRKQCVLRLCLLRR
jgi:hypothetical protein